MFSSSRRALGVVGLLFSRAWNRVMQLVDRLMAALNAFPAYFQSLKEIEFLLHSGVPQFGEACFAMTLRTYYTCSQ
jgi:hypothetical protein